MTVARPAIRNRHELVATGNGYTGRLGCYIREAQWERMESVTAINVHQFGAGLLVELIGEDERGEIAVRSFEFEWSNCDRSRVRPVMTMAQEDARLIENRLVAAGYEVDTEPQSDPPSPSAGSRGSALSN